MAYRNIIIESPARISVKNEQFIVYTDCERSIAVEDISALLLESRQSTITAAALSFLGQSGCAVYFCDDKHMPCSVMVPFSQHSRQRCVTDLQLAAGLTLKKRLWQNIAISKINNQAACLRLNGYPEASVRLANLAKRVRPGDAENIEANAAAHYFTQLFGAGFTRSRDNGLNAALNYGYAILRGCVARNLAIYGLIPALGLHHCSQLNAFNLADDLMEPFRPVTDLVVSTYFGPEDCLTPTAKQLLFNQLNLDILSGGEHHSVSYAVERSVQSLVRSFNQNASALVLPELLDLKQHKYE